MRCGGLVSDLMTRDGSENSSFPLSDISTTRGEGRTVDLHTLVPTFCQWSPVAENERHSPHHHAATEEGEGLAGLGLGPGLLAATLEGEGHN